MLQEFIAKAIWFLKIYYVENQLLPASYVLAEPEAVSCFEKSTGDFLSACRAGRHRLFHIGIPGDWHISSI